MSGAGTGSQCGKARGTRGFRGSEDEEGRRKRPEAQHYKPPGAKKGSSSSSASASNATTNATPITTNHASPTTQLTSSNSNNSNNSSSSNADNTPNSNINSNINSNSHPSSKTGSSSSGNAKKRYHHRREKSSRKTTDSAQTPTPPTPPLLLPLPLPPPPPPSSSSLAPAPKSGPDGESLQKQSRQAKGSSFQYQEQNATSSGESPAGTLRKRQAGSAGAASQRKDHSSSSEHNHQHQQSNRDRRHWNGGSRTSRGGGGGSSRRSKDVLPEQPQEQMQPNHLLDSSRKPSLSSSETSSKNKSEEVLIERITDWSLEIEMEDEKKRREKEAERLRPRDPPRKQTRTSSSHNNNNNTTLSNNTKNAGGIIRIPPGESNSAWRSGHKEEGGSESYHRGRGPRYDHAKHNSKASGHPRGGERHHHHHQGGGGGHLPSRDHHHHIPSQDFYSPSYNGSGGGGMIPPPGPPNLPPSLGHPYQPHPMIPPYGLSLRPNGPEWYDVFNSRIYGNDIKHDINNISLIGRCDARIYEITMLGRWDILSQLWETEIAECRKNILKAFEELLKSDLVFCLKHNVEFHIWKIAFWNLTEVLKILLQKEDSPELRGVIKTHISQLIEEGIDFYEGALRLLEKTYNIDLESYYDVLKPRPSDKFQRCVLASAQNCLICLGDLARYKELVNETSNLGKVRRYYLKAASIETRNGRPFHMMAILANMVKRKLEAIYYHMRCLQCKNAFRTAQQSLTVIFEEFKKNWEAHEREKILERERKLRNSEHEKEGSRYLIKGTRLRNEIWIKSEGGRRLHRTTSARESETIDEEELELMEMNSIDLCKRFITTFIYLLGKLFTYIDMDSFPLALEILLKEFRVLISISPLPIDVRSLVQIMAMNMFIIEHTKMKNGDTTSYRSSMQTAALQLSFEMFGILIERCNIIYQKIIPQIQGGPFSVHEDLSVLLPPVKVWCDWMLGNNDTWYPVVSEEPFNQLATLATHLEKLKPLMRPILSSFATEDTAQEDDSFYTLVKLEEDAILCGLNTWFRGMDWASYRRYYPKGASFSSRLATEVRRLDAINFCVEFLEGLESPILKWSLPDNAHISLVESNELCSAVDKVNAKLSNMLACQEDILDESYSEDEQQFNNTDKLDTDMSIPNEEIRALKHRKEVLERQRMVEEREMSRIQKKILSDHVSVTLEVRPHYIVADTNCFVDHLDGIQTLVSSSQYHLRVPLVVLNELDGLSKGARPSKYSSQEHANMVSENARRACNFLRSRPPNSKCVTARGTVFNSFNVTSEEEFNGGKTNDDLILGVCLNLSSNKEETRGNMRIVYRDVVLLTDDRNLKLKAHITDIPVNKFVDFFSWAKLS